MRYLLLSLSFIALLTGCDVEQAPTAEPLRPVRYLTVDNPETFRSRTFSGSSRSSQESRLSFKVSGTLIELPVQVGDELNAGDLVARLDASQYRLQVQQSQASFVQAQANARNAAANYQRVKGLYENNNASRNDLDSARATAESATAQQRSAQKALELARLNLSYTRLTVDADCSVAALSAEINENVNVGTQVAQVNCGSELEVTTEVPESLIASISQNMPVDIRFNAVPDKRYKGLVAEVGIAASGNATTFPVSVKLDNPDSALRSGLAAEVTFAFATPSTQSAYLVPIAAVVNGVDGPYVFIAEPAEQAGQAIVRKKPVTLGELTEAGLEILTGIASGDKVITAGVSVIRDGQAVLLL